ncbi:hypothetical protein ACUNV4_21285 [Granulosicoccus sp. 3-233]|uniref:hypothetical protein n=1 Tax=Granulosicoccus sp. 3-233 TaxID=3417969 RepID=UPI003D32AB88
MTTEKRGSEKLLNADGGLCELTAEEVSQVAGAQKPLNGLWPRDSFPLGTIDPDLFRELATLNVQINPDKLIDVAGISERMDMTKRY